MIKPAPKAPALVSNHPDLVIRAISVSTMDNNVYLLTCRATGVMGLIDAADEPSRVLALVRSAAEQAQNSTARDEDQPASALAWILTTHQHWDHHRALLDVVAATKAVTYAGAEDADALPVPVSGRLHQGDQIALGELTIDVVHLRGHTPGSIALIARSTDGSVHAFTGDSLFPGGVGNTRGSAEDFAQLIDDVEHRLFDQLPDRTIVYPGHGRTTTLGAERGSLADWRERGW